MWARIWKWFKLGFDRSFSVARWRQFVWLLGMLIGFYLLFFLINSWLNPRIVEPVHILELMIDPGAVSAEDVYEVVSADSCSTGYDEAEARAPKEHSPNRWFSFLIAIFGAVTFTGILVSVISNILEARVEAFKNGLVRYSFTNHILLFGGGEILIGIIRSLVSNPENNRMDIVVLTTQNIEELQNLLRSRLSSLELHRIVLLFGNRDSDEELLRVRVQYANRVYITGCSNEKDHDALNISCYERIKKLVSSRKTVLKCFVVIDNLTSYHVFQYQKSSPVCQTELTLIDIQESWAQQVLVSRRYEQFNYPAIDREGIGADTGKRVHFVVFGMTQMALAMATTVAHIAHYPNFKTKGLRTKITFVAPDIEQEMNFFKGHYHSLFALSHSVYRAEYKTVSFCPDTEYGDFLDVEWEFVDGGIETEPVRDLIKKWCELHQSGSDILTFAVCGKEPVANLASALYMPDVVHRMKIPVFVYQSDTSEIIEQARKTERYQHLYPFGMIHDCYDSQLYRRILHAKRINYVYSECDNYVMMTKDMQVLDALWYQLPFANQLSNIFAANSIHTKLRSMRAEGINASALTDADVERYAEVEHNRWNIEKLLVGFSALTIEERKVLLSQADNPETKNAAQQKSKRLKGEFRHKDITPYDRLCEDSRHYDVMITRFLNDVIE